MIEVSQLTKRFAGRPAVVDVTFSVTRGQVVAVCGPPGAGKSTLLRILAGGLVPTAGSAAVDGHDVVSRSRDVRRRIGYLPPVVGLYDDMRVERYLELLCRLRGVPPGRRASLIAGALDSCELAGVRRELVGQLSDELRRRVALVQTVVHDPPVLLLDEPAAAADGARASTARSLVSRLAGARTVIVSGRSASDPGVACDRVLVLEEGRLVADEASSRPKAEGDWAEWEAEEAARRIEEAERQAAEDADRAAEQDEWWEDPPEDSLLPPAVRPGGGVEGRA